ncbi:MAG: fatty acid desaturase, partial [Myxococcales bacterium]|nr:fatty acid desaturase [Myxococcales bacterium]
MIEAVLKQATISQDERINWIGSIPIILMHLGCFAAIWTGVDGRAIALFLITFWVRMFSITGGYHRYFAHRTFKTSRIFQFLLAFVGTTASQKGPLWWAGHHRIHHRFSDQPEDRHSPKQRGIWFAHIGWILCDKYKDTPVETIRDFAKYPELLWLNRYWAVPPTILAIATLLIGGWSGFVWGFVISTVALWHATFVINSFAHTIGRRRYDTADTSRNNWAFALLTMGEGWHNN